MADRRKLTWRNAIVLGSALAVGFYSGTPGGWQWALNFISQYAK